MVHPFDENILPDEGKTMVNDINNVKITDDEAQMFWALIQHKKPDIALEFYSEIKSNSTNKDGGGNNKSKSDGGKSDDGKATGGGPGLGEDNLDLLMKKMYVTDREDKYLKLKLSI